MLRPRIGRVELRKVDKLSTIRVASARYSVPHRLVGAQVEAVTFDGRVRIYDLDGELVADHAQLAPGEAAVLDEHYPTPRGRRHAGHAPAPMSSGSSSPSANRPRCSSVTAPPPGSTMLPKEIIEIVDDLLPAHGPELVAKAVARAARFGRFRAADVRSILAIGTAAAGTRRRRRQRRRRAPGRRGPLVRRLPDGEPRMTPPAASTLAGRSRSRPEAAEAVSDPPRKHPTSSPPPRRNAGRPTRSCASSSTLEIAARDESNTPQPDDRRPVPDRQDPRRVPPRPSPRSRSHPTTTWSRSSGSTEPRTCASSDPPAPAKPTTSSASDAPPSPPATRSATSPPSTSSNTSTAPSPTTPSAEPSKPCAATT